MRADMPGRIVSVAVILALCAAAPARAGEWLGEDTARQAAVMLLFAADWTQTRQIAANPDRYRELNPLLGPHPTRAQVDAHFASVVVGHAVIAYLLPHEWRAAWQWITIGVESATVYHNYRIGLRIGL